MTQIKTIFCTLALALGGLAKAGDGGPSAMISEPSIIAQVKTVGGFVGPDFVHSQVVVYSNGQVKEETPPTARLLTTLSPEVLAKFKASIEDVVDARLVDTSNSIGMCADAPETTYSVFQASGKEIKIARQENCRHYVLPEGGAYTLRQALEGFVALRHLSN